MQAGFNDLATRYPNIAAEAYGWDPTTVTSKSHLKLRWRCVRGHEWEATVSTRTPPISAGCPYCSGNKVLAGFNDLATVYPDIAAQAYGWDPKTVSAGSCKKLTWRCREGHFWVAQVGNRTPPQGLGCPICSGHQVLPGFNDLATLFPEIAAQADGWDPSTVTRGSKQKHLWRCWLGHTYRASIGSRTPPRNSGCPFCAGKQVLAGFNDLATLFPEVANQADKWDPASVAGKSSKMMPWRCKKGHTWNATVVNRTGNSSGCPECAEFGFKRELPAWFYLLERPGEQQLGITNRREGRVYEHYLNGWVLIEMIGPFPGEIVLATEIRFKKWLRKEVGLVPGTHENWFTARMEVQSLAELKERSGIETDLF
ncbi:zinc-ribbon domain-containing protein [Synechococcus sp. CS-1332]|uniref:zinc-ribbon domain-containing protein n=1 Tax=Synechococcus sp. CS-1332 TaxID=2847972 RepID=UPI00223C3D26|nr:zinc-ribbon domain-containing protein [Synechococcus sp. CS-1332]